MTPNFTTSFNSITKQLADFVDKLAKEPLHALTPETRFEDLNNQIKKLGSRFNPDRDGGLSPELVDAYLYFARGMLETAYGDTEEALQSFETMFSSAEMAELAARNRGDLEMDGKASLSLWITENVDKSSDLYRQAEPLIGDALERVSTFAPLESQSFEEDFLHQPPEFDPQEASTISEEPTFDPAKISSWRDLSDRIDVIAAAVAQAADPALIEELVAELGERLELAAKVVTSYDDPVGPFYGLVDAKLNLIQGLRVSIAEAASVNMEQGFSLKGAYFESALGIATHWLETDGLIEWAEQLREKHPQLELYLNDFTLAKRRHL